MPTDSNFPPITRADYIALSAVKYNKLIPETSDVVKARKEILINRRLLQADADGLKLTARGHQAHKIYEAWRANEASRLARSLDEAMQLNTSNAPPRGWIITAFLIGFISAAYLAIPLLLN